MKNIFLTFDYELFFGEDSGTLENSILKPTDLLLDTLKECNAPATFYIDTIYIEKLLEYKLYDEYELVKSQIQRMIKEGHRAELHLHPHWYDAIYIPETKRWKFPTYEHYRLHSYSEKEIETIFDKSVDILYNIIHEVNNSYRFHSYRAGGWCIQPFDKIKPSLEKHGIFVDSSTAFGMKSDSIAHYFDFTNMPLKDIYNFSNDVLIEENQGKFTEIPSSVVKINIFFKIINKLLLKLSKAKIYGDGSGIDLNLPSIFSKLSISYRIMSIENISKYLIKSLINQVQCNNVIITSHPKFLSNESLNCINTLAKNYKINTFKEI